MRGKVLHLRAASETEALSRVFEKFGREAVIGEIRQVRMQGLAGLFGKKEVEVSVRIKELEAREKDAERFRALVSQVGKSIRADQDEGYFKQWEAALAKVEIGGSLAGKILSSARARPCDPDAFARVVTSAIPIKTQLPRVMALVGPTGTGKTTIAAKLSGINGYKLGKRVAIITLDTSRIGAVEQLRIYTKIMGIPLSVVSSPGELKEHLERYHDYEQVYIDTPGRAPGNMLSLAELQTFLAECSDIEVAMVVSATTKLNDLSLIHKDYYRLAPSCLIVTKVDETASLGSIVTFIHQSSLPLFCIGIGQGVPQDIQFASSQIVSKWVVSGLNPYRGDRGGTSIGWQNG